MPVPKRKRSRARRDKRFANKGIKAQQFTNCQNCTEVITPHTACKHCGHYKGDKVLKTKSERQYKRAETNQIREARQQAMKQESKAAKAALAEHKSKAEKDKEDEKF